MRLWIPLAMVAVIVVAYAFFYVLGSLEQQGATSFGLANTVGLLAVVIGVIAAGMILRRATPN
ncbi:MAG: hypothetical protein LYZ69_02430 [Nitrososphaerales archaeon]|nr:hypothetical protein [Nitrososphaerales archaeon]